MPLTPEELAQISGAFTETLNTARAADQAKITELESQVAAAKTEAETARSQAEAAARRPAIYGADGQPVISTRMSKEDRKDHVTQRVGNYVRSLAASRGDLRAAADFAERVYHDKGTAEALTRAMSEGVLGDGGSLVETQYAPDMIELLYARAVVRRAGARVTPMVNGNLTIHRQATGVTGQYVGELQTIALQQPTVDTVTLSAKKLAVIVPVSNELLHDTSGRVNEMIVSDIGIQLGLREDLAFLRGTGDGGISPVGVLNQVDPAFIRTYTSLSGVVAGQRALINSANLPMRNVGWIFNSDVEARFYSMLSTTGQYVFRDEMNQGKLLGFPYLVSNQLPSNLTSAGGTAGTEIYFGDWSEVIIGEAMALQLETSREASYWNGTAEVSAFHTDQTLFRAITRHDLALRHRKALSVGRVDLTTVTDR